MVPEYFDSSIIKRNKDGEQVISTTLDEGETLITGETYQQVVDGILLSKNHDTPLTPIRDKDAVVPTMTLDATKTSTFSGTTEGYSNSGEDVSSDERDEAGQSGYDSIEDDSTDDVEESKGSDDDTETSENDTVLTLDETKTNTVAAKEDDVDDERQEAPTKSGAPATEDAPSEDGEPNSGEQPTENTSVSTSGDDSTVARPKDSESKEKWFKYAASVSAERGEDFPYEDDYEGVTKATLVEQYGA